jgi:L-threonylcarbamoyladenylate synthase
MIRAGSDPLSIQYAARMLELGKLVAFPTETVYGLGADAENAAAVAAIFAAKGRPSNHPVIVHLAVGANLSHWAQSIPVEADKLIAAFWPGPLTLILKRAASIPDAVSGGQDSIGLRCPSHPVTLALLAAFKNGQGGIAGPSANRFGHVSPTLAQHVVDEFGEDEHSPLACVLDGGQSEVGIESTILDLSRIDSAGPVLLRPGHITAAQIEAVIDRAVALPDVAAPRASGTLAAHYAPQTPVALVPAAELAQITQALAQSGRRFALMLRVSDVAKDAAAAALGLRRLPQDPDAYAHDLYASLRELDSLHSDIILIEQLPEDLRWQGINDRLRRAAFDSSGVLAQLLPPSSSLQA